MIEIMNSSDIVIVCFEKRLPKSIANESRMRIRAAGFSNFAFQPADSSAEHEHPAPAVVGANQVVGERGEEEPEVVAGVHVAGAHLAAILGPLLRDEGAADRLLTAKTDAAEHAQDGELPHGLREAAGEREDRVHEDRRHQRLDASEAVGDRSPHHRHAPSGQEQREQDAAVETYVARRRRNA
jgi:hypothetical protein